MSLDCREAKQNSIWCFLIAGLIICAAVAAYSILAMEQIIKPLTLYNR